MPLGYMRFNKAIFDRWTPQRLVEFEQFCSIASTVKVSTEESEIPSESAYLYKLNHPHFLSTDGEPFYVFKWGKVLDDTGHNYSERIVALYIQRPNYTTELIHAYRTDKVIRHASSPSL